MCVRERVCVYVCLCVCVCVRVLACMSTGLHVHMACICEEVVEIISQVLRFGNIHVQYQLDCFIFECRFSCVNSAVIFFLLYVAVPHPCVIRYGKMQINPKAVADHLFSVCWQAFICSCCDSDSCHHVSVCRCEPI